MAKKKELITEDLPELFVEDSLLSTESEVQKEPEETMHFIFVSSAGVETVQKGAKKFVRGDVNGVRFEVECDTQVAVKPEIAGALQGLIDKQAGRDFNAVKAL